MAMPLTYRRFTVDEYHRMAEAGIFHEDDRLELLDGQVVEMTPIGRRHVACVVRLTDLLAERAGSDVSVSVQNPLLLAPRSEPQPDLALLRRRADPSGAWLPERGDALLVIEVADTSVERDREKVRLYAAAGIPEAWLVNLPADTIEVYRDPGPEGYGEMRTARRGERLTLAQLPDVTVPVEEILG